MPYKDAKSYAAAVSGASGRVVQQPPSRGRSSRMLLSPSGLMEPHRLRSRLSFGSNANCDIRKDSNDKNSEQHKWKDSVAVGPARDTFIPGPRYVESPAPFHKPNTDKEEEEHVYVLTLQVTESMSIPINEMREKHFPKHLNKTPAHLTLFHALPHSQLDSLEENLTTLSRTTMSFYISTGTAFRMRRGVGVNLGAGFEEIKILRDTLRLQWLPFLSDQDSGAWQPHWTVMNKVDEQKRVENAFNTVRRDLFENEQEGRAVGFELWRYNKGTWEWVTEYDFLCNGKGPTSSSADSPEPSPSKLRKWSIGRKGSESSHSTSPRRVEANGGKVAGLWRPLSFRRRS